MEGTNVEEVSLEKREIIKIFECYVLVILLFTMECFMKGYKF